MSVVVQGPQALASHPMMLDSLIQSREWDHLLLPHEGRWWVLSSIVSFCAYAGAHFPKQVTHLCMPDFTP